MLDSGAEINVLQEGLAEEYNLPIRINAKGAMRSRICVCLPVDSRLQKHLKKKSL